jgi:hypothetical protein
MPPTPISRKVPGRLAAGAAGAILAFSALVGTTGWTAPAGAFGISTSCGPGVEAHNCPPLCMKLAPLAAVDRIFHAKFKKPTYYVDGEPGDTCTYAEAGDPNSTVSDSIDSHQTVADFNNQVKVTKEFNRGAVVQAVPALGRYAVDIVHCIGTGSSAWCYPNMLAYSKGYLLTMGEALDTVNLAVMDKRYVPELVAWAKLLFAKA